MDLEDRFKLIFIGFGGFRWIRVKMATYLDLEDLNEFERLRLEFRGFGWIWAQIRVDF